MEIDGLVQQVLTGLDMTHPTKPEPVSDLDATTKSLDEILNSISTPPPEAPTKHETALDKLIAELQSATPLSPNPEQTGQNQPVPLTPFGPQEDWGEERY